MGVFALAVPAAFAEQEYTLEFGLLLNETTADEAERGYNDVIGRAKSVPAVEFDIAVERVTNDCETVVKGSPGLFSSRTRYYPCGMELEASEYGWVAMVEGTAKSTDRDALLAVAAEMRPHAYELDIGESRQQDLWLLLVGAALAVALCIVLGKKYPDPFVCVLLFAIGCVVTTTPYAMATVLNDATYTSLLDWPAGIPSIAGAANVPAGTGPADTPMECSPVSGAGMPDGAVLCVP